MPKYVSFCVATKSGRPNPTFPSTVFPFLHVGRAHQIAAARVLSSSLTKCQPVLVCVYSRTARPWLRARQLSAWRFPARAVLHSACVRLLQRSQHLPSWRRPSRARQVSEGWVGPRHGSFLHRYSGLIVIIEHSMLFTLMSNCVQHISHSTVAVIQQSA